MGFIPIHSIFLSSTWAGPVHSISCRVNGPSSEWFRTDAMWLLQQRHRIPQDFSLMSLIITSFIRTLVVSFAQQIFPPSVRLCNINIESLGEAFPTQKIGASAASNIAQGSCGHQTIHQPLTFWPSLSMHMWWRSIEAWVETKNQQKTNKTFEILPIFIYLNLNMTMADYI